MTRGPLTFKQSDVVEAAITPADLARAIGCSERLVRERARALGACRIFGKRMFLMPIDVLMILKASVPGVTNQQVKDWLGADAAEQSAELEAQEWADPTGVVYFIQRGPQVKIGFTTDLRRRLVNFRTATTEPFMVLLTVPGTPRLEEYFHEKFAHHHVEREWFKLAGDLSEFIVRRASADA